MFKRIVSNISFSPSTVVQLGVYAAKLKQESRLRSIGLILITLTLLLQILVVLLPPRAANSASHNDLMYGGVSSIDDILAYYDNNEHNVQDILTTIGIRREDIAQLRPSSIKLDDRLITGRTPLVGEIYGEQTYRGGAFTFSVRPSNTIPQPEVTFTGWEGTSPIGDFAILQQGGNVVLDSSYKLPSSVVTHPNVTIAAYNVSQHQVAHETEAKPGERIEYTLTIENSTDVLMQTDVTHSVKDLLEYTEIIGGSSGVLDDATKSLVWHDLLIQPHQSITRQFTVRVVDTIPAIAMGTSDPLSYDCTLTSAAYNIIHVAVQCPLAKSIERVSALSPATPNTNMTLVYITMLTLVSVLFYLRSRLLQKEVRAIRHKINTGAL